MGAALLADAAAAACAAGADNSASSFLLWQGPLRVLLQHCQGLLTAGLKRSIRIKIKMPRHQGSSKVGKGSVIGGSG